ncbi:MAG: lytic transglycosylase domain-containing protein [Bdellovibrionales bacterium]|nr:lytic transglycosylase domain-containing protein [Bdellovibrionales bacterium]
MNNHEMYKVISMLLFLAPSMGSANIAMKSQNSFKNPIVKKVSPAPITYVAEPSIIFDLPVEYNSKVRTWIDYFQTRGRDWFAKWLERSSKMIPQMQAILTEQGLPKDLVYMAMIESGFSHHAESHAQAVGPWQFIAPTANRYGLKISWWIDERRDLHKSTVAAARYLGDLYRMFGSWYLVAAAYNTGENRIKRAVQKYHSKDFWTLAQKNALHPETMNYVPKLIAAMLISKAPGLYGFRNINYKSEEDFDHFVVPGGTNLKDLAMHLGVTYSHLESLNPEILSKEIPRAIAYHRIRIPKGSTLLVSQYVRTRFAAN